MAEPSVQPSRGRGLASIATGIGAGRRGPPPPGRNQLPAPGDRARPFLGPGRAAPHRSRHGCSGGRRFQPGLRRPGVGGGAGPPPMGCPVALGAGEPDLVPLRAALQPAPARRLGHRPLGRVADGHHRRRLDGGLLHRPGAHPAAAPARRTCAGCPRLLAALEARLDAALGRRCLQAQLRPAPRGQPLDLGLLLTLAFTAFSLNFYRELFLPAISLVSQRTPSPLDAVPGAAITPRLDWAEALARARAEAARLGWREPAGALYHARFHGVYGVQFFRPEDGHGSGGVGHRELYIDSRDGRVLGQREPWKGTAADLFVQAQFPLHSGRILGLPGRVLISAMGLVVATLSVTGVVIWWRKRRASLRPRPPAAAPPT